MEARWLTCAARGGLLHAKCQRKTTIEIHHGKKKFIATHPELDLETTELGRQHLVTVKSETRKSLLSALPCACPERCCWLLIQETVVRLSPKVAVLMQLSGVVAIWIVAASCNFEN